MNKENRGPCNPSEMKRRTRTKYNLRGTHSDCQGNSEGSAKKDPKKCNAGIATDPAHVNFLPNEILAMIFSYLNMSQLAKSVLPVCKRWNDIANGPLFWRHLKFGPQGTTEDILKVVEKSTLLKFVEIHNRNDFGPILQEVYHNCKYSNNSIDGISLKMCPMVNPRTPYRPESFLFRTQLRKCCDATNCTQNKVLGGGIINVPHSTNMFDFCPNLKILSLINVIIRSKKFFGRIGESLKSLTTLTIIRCNHFSPANLQLIATNCVQLSHVTILHNVLDLQLTTVEIENAWDNAFQNLLQKRGPLLQLLEMDAKFVEDNTLKTLSASTRMHTLSLENGRNLSADGISAISKLRYLDHLHIHNCAGLDEETIAQMFSPGNLGLLESLTMTRCGNITDQCLELISSSCPRINKINFSFCRLITDAGVEFLFQRCIKLRYLNLFSTVGIHGSSFQLIPQKTPSLRLLIIEEYCDKIKEKYMKDLIARFPGLQIRRWKQIY